MKKSILFISALISSKLIAQVEAPGPPQPSVAINVEQGRNSIIDFPERDASFKGGPKAFQQYFINNIIYPQLCIEEHIQGRVFISFVVEKNGAISNVVVEKGVHPLLNAEAIRLVKSMPKWKPGKMKGIKVRTRCRLPINFILTD
jgi:periplasmic protein TonB